MSNLNNVLPGTVIAVDEDGMRLVKTEDDRRRIDERMRDGGMRLGDLIEAMYNDGEALATTLNGLYFLDMGYAQPDQGDDEETWVWDGTWVWDDDHMVYMGADGPGGGRKPKSMVLNNDSLVCLFN